MVDSAVLERGTNDRTPHYRSRRLFLEDTIIPVHEVVRQEGKIKAFRIRQTISQTWIGEHGRGYFVQGIWMDLDLTKFFTRLFLPRNKRTYPYYPYLCKYKTVCQSGVDLSPSGRRTAVPWLHRSLGFILPFMEEIQAEIKNQAFSEDMPIFLRLKQQVPPAWYDAWKDLKVEAYLNDADMKEYRVDD